MLFPFEYLRGDQTFLRHNGFCSTKSLSFRKDQSQMAPWDLQQHNPLASHQNDNRQWVVHLCLKGKTSACLLLVETCHWVPVSGDILLLSTISMLPGKKALLLQETAGTNPELAVDTLEMENYPKANLATE